MVMIANLQYGWNLFVNPISQAASLGPRRDPGGLQPVRAHRNLAGAGGGLVRRPFRPAHCRHGGRRSGGRWPGPWTPSPTLCPCSMLAAILSGIGAGAVYGTCVGNALKWFVGRRGLAAGMTAAGFGAGAAATVVPIREVIAAHGYQSAFLWFGLGQGGVILIASQFLRAPATKPVATAPHAQSADQPQLHAAGGAEDAAILAAVCDVRAGGGGRTDRHGAICLHRRRFRRGRTAMSPCWASPARC